MTDVTAVLHSVPAEGGDEVIGFALRCAEPSRRARLRTAAASAVRDHVVAAHRGAGVEHFARPLCCGVEAVDHVAFAHRFRIAGRRQHDADSCARIPVDLGARQAALERSLAERRDVRAHPRQDRLRFRVAETAVELEHLRRAAGVDHQARIQEADVGRAFGGRARARVGHMTSCDRALEIAGVTTGAGE